MDKVKKCSEGIEEIDILILNLLDLSIYTYMSIAEIHLDEVDKCVEEIEVLI